MASLSITAHQLRSFKEAKPVASCFDYGNVDENAQSWKIEFCEMSIDIMQAGSLHTGLMTVVESIVHH